MSNSISRIYDDMARYEALCKKYGETPQYSNDAYGNSLLDCYGTHAGILESRSHQEWMKTRVLENFPIGTRFYSFGLDSCFTVAEIRDDVVIACMDHDAQLRDSGHKAYLYPTVFPFDYMTNYWRVRKMSDWEDLTQEQRESAYNYYLTQTKKG